MSSGCRLRKLRPCPFFITTINRESLDDWMLTPLKILDMHVSCLLVSMDGGSSVAGVIKDVGVVEVLVGWERRAYTNAAR